MVLKLYEKYGISHINHYLILVNSSLDCPPENGIYHVIVISDPLWPEPVIHGSCRLGAPSGGNSATIMSMWYQILRHMFSPVLCVVGWEAWWETLLVWVFDVAFDQLSH